MQVGSISATGPKNQSALKLITNIVEAIKSDQSSAVGEDKSWSTVSSAGSVSSRSAAAIQDLVQGKATGTTTFKVLGGKERTVPSDEYEFAAKTEFQTPEQLAADYIKNEVGNFQAALVQAQSDGLTEQAKFLTSQIDSLKRALSSGTFKVELLDDRVTGNDYRFTPIRDSAGNIGGMRGVNEKPLDWDAFNKVYGDGKGNYDRNYWVGGNYFMRGYVISWPK